MIVADLEVDPGTPIHPSKTEPQEVLLSVTGERDHLWLSSRDEPLGSAVTPSWSRQLSGNLDTYLIGCGAAPMENRVPVYFALRKNVMLKTPRTPAFTGTEIASKGAIVMFLDSASYALWAARERERCCEAGRPYLFGLTYPMRCLGVDVHIDNSPAMFDDPRPSLFPATLDTLSPHRRTL